MGIETRILRDGKLRLDPPGFEVAVAELFMELPEDERQG